MGSIADIHNPWRDRLRPASFRGVGFHVDAQARAGGRRTAVHEYPKRNLPYAEDMGRRARRWQVQAYLIGPYYLADRDDLITALEADGPGTLIMPLPYLGEQVEVMVERFGSSENRERGGFVAFEIEFVEAGSPGFDVEQIDTRSAIDRTASVVENI